MKYVLTALIAVVAMMFVAAPVTADWDREQPAKWVQFPDPLGWDVDFVEDPQGLRRVRLADDFPCTETGKITDVHLWFSVRGDQIDPRQVIQKIQLSIHDNIPPNPTDPSFPWSRPADPPLWEDSFVPNSIRLVGTGEQGYLWPSPVNPEFIPPPDHLRIWQANILIDPARAFEQKGTAANPKIYWLDASVILQPGVTFADLGWKTSKDRWHPGPDLLDDDAVFWFNGSATGGPPTGWYPIHDPRTGESLNLAFVITPEPGTVVMLIGAGLIGLVAYARRRRMR